MKLLNRLQGALFPDDTNVTPEVLEHYRKHPEDLDLIINKEYFHSVFLGICFGLGIIITFGARIIQYYYGNVLGGFINTIILDMISELGIAIFGGAIVAYMIEFLKKQQYQKNLKFRNYIKRALVESQNEVIAKHDT
ncbi:hypothetical protein [Tunicatimonas pelagia]|uniref:hypothetical protein n=1 Tax=Tunicatimonas pelagia TaxID=931531 RepID=UPI002665D46F|nr:hypothetical protein [Tunicatimonas pelagia]WKN43067.1 hypothetical protein P0M28_28930 [Tunicatimonas pelagia]